MIELYTIHESKVGHGDLCIDSLGYGILKVDKKFSEYHVLSAHCPAVIDITFHKPVRIMGCMNGTTKWDSGNGCCFLVNSEPIGYLFGAYEHTEEIVLEPNRYLLEISSVDHNYKHSLFLIKHEDCSS